MKIAFIYYDSSSFVRQDKEILSRHFDVKEINYRRLSDVFKIIDAVLGSDISFSWFASGHSFLAVLISKILNKRSVVVAGGYDVAYVPEIGYGQFTQSWQRRMMTAFALRYADLVLPVSEFTKKEVLRRSKPKELKVIYNGVDVERFRKGASKEDLVITVSGISWSNLRRKGLETLIRSAKMVPEARFVIIGKEMDDSIDYLRSIAPSNVKFTGFVSDKELLEWYQRAKIYVQISAYESFGMSLAEAMLCECVPVVSDRGALPEVVGDTGFYVPYGDEGATAEGIKMAFRSDRGSIARERIKRLFTKDRRETELLKAIDVII